jgi:branched-chain amino acid transport system permease protein
MTNISYILLQVFNGIQFGVLIALLATGLSLIFGMLGIVNFAHGSLYMLGAYFLWTCMRLLHNMSGSFWLGLIFTLPLMAIVGLISERFILRRMYSQPLIYQFLITFGLMLVIQQSVALVYGTSALPLRIPSGFEGEINLGFIYYPVYRLFTMILGLMLIFCIWFFIERSTIGAIIRASAEDPETTKTLGINTRNVYTLTFILGSVLAGLGGALHAPIIGGIQHAIGGEILLICFIVVIIGGMGSIRGALLGGIILGIIRGIAGIIWAPGSDLFMFVAMGIVLFFRPQGLLGRKGV